MRLSGEQRKAIVSAVNTCFGYRSRVKLFGSRADDRARGGDIDLLISTDMQDVDEIVRAEMRCLAQLQQTLGEQRIDLLIDYPGRRVYPPIFDVARQSGLSL